VAPYRLERLGIGHEETEEQRDIKKNGEWANMDREEER
jgi:hypothetical protein